MKTINKIKRYYTTLESEKWKKLKEFKIRENQQKYGLTQDYFKCEYCKKYKDIWQSNLHHTSYKYGICNKKYVKLVCEDCHEKWHLKNKIKY